MSLRRLLPPESPKPSAERYLVLLPPPGAGVEGEESAVPDERAHYASSPPAVPPNFRRLSASLPSSRLYSGGGSSGTFSAPAPLSFTSFSSLSSPVVPVVRSSSPFVSTKDENQPDEDQGEGGCSGEEEVRLCNTVGKEEEAPQRNYHHGSLPTADKNVASKDAPLVWRPDHEVELCAECGVRFTLLLRRGKDDVEMEVRSDTVL